MAYRTYRCESCPTRVGVDEKLKQRPLACPKCRGMLVLEGKEEQSKGTKVECSDCENSFYAEKPPFKCAFCDHTFSKDYKYF